MAPFTGHQREGDGQVTPFEELQAAHKRLSELRAKTRVTSPGTWQTHPDYIIGTTDLESTHGAVAEFYREVDADLIVTLHRTIDAQLAILQYSFVFAEWHERPQPDGGGAMRTELYHALELARAINRDR